MPEAVVDKEACSKCGAEVRENTAFCYACGNRVATEEPVNGKTEVDANTRAALDDLAEKLSSDEQPEAGDKLAKAAAERKKARVSQRKPKEFVWEPYDETPQGLLLATAAAFIIAVFVVVVLVVWK
ncbi:MAG TPA: zinc ribbon domain-containing protein [Pyrinomonadaceae bacterium]|nr:zinc ribbon domain-containing protein [Pyrinomonadaceae bacterium]